MQFHRMFLLLNFYLWMITFTDGLECELSDKNDKTRVKRSAIHRIRIRRQSDEVEACYMTLEVDYLTRKYSIYYSDSLTDGDKGTEHGSIQMITTLTFDPDSTMVNGSERFRGVITYTCKEVSGCNKNIELYFLFFIQMMFKSDIVPMASIKTLRHLLLKNKEETELNKPVRCFVDDSNQPIECEYSLCFVNLTDNVKQSCADQSMNGLVQVTFQFSSMSPVSPWNYIAKVSYTCNADQCNSIETINQMKEAIGMNSYNVIDLIKNLLLGNLFPSNSSVEGLLMSLSNLKDLEGIFKAFFSANSNQSSTTTTTASTTSTHTVHSTTSGKNTGNGDYPIFILLCIALIIAIGF